MPSTPNDPLISSKEVSSDPLDHHASDDKALPSQALANNTLPEKAAPYKALHYFQVAAQTRSFEMASQQLHVTRGAISQQIKMLENWLGKELFSRQTNALTLTPAGKQLLPFLMEGFGIIHQSVSALSDKQTLIISSSHSFSTFWLAPRSSDFQKKHPDIQLQLQPSNQILDANQFQCDIAIRMNQPEEHKLPPHWQSRDLFSNKLILVGTPEFCTALTAHPNWLQVPFLLDNSADIQPAVNALCEYLHINTGQLTAALQTTDSVPLIYAALKGQGVALVSLCLVEQHIDSGELQRIGAFEYCDDRMFHLVAPNRHFQQNKVMRFLEWLFEIAR